MYNNQKSRKFNKSLLSIVLGYSLLIISGCWFVYIPGSVIEAVSDGITGDEGEHCVAANAKVGDIISLPGGGRGTIVSLSGKSMRCKDSRIPIRALLEFAEYKSGGGCTSRMVDGKMVRDCE